MEEPRLLYHYIDPLLMRDSEEASNWIAQEFTNKLFPEGNVKVYMVMEQSFREGNCGVKIIRTKSGIFLSVALDHTIPCGTIKEQFSGKEAVPMYPYGEIRDVS